MPQFLLFGLMMVMCAFSACSQEKEEAEMGEQIEEFNFGPNTGD